MPQRKATETLYMNADRTELVPEGHEDAAFLFVRKGSAINEAEAQRYGFDVQGVDAAEYDAVADHAAKHGGLDPTTDLTEAERRQRMLSGVDDPDGPAAPGERGNLVLADEEGDGPAEGDAKATDGPADTKAVRRAPSNKGA